ncbi:leucine-rich repeat protein, partial [bacterium]|nr:leucine-rich repeat protein [bacterium]
EIKYIQRGEVQNKQVTVNVGTSNQNIVATIDNNGNISSPNIVAGFYDDNNTLLYSWETVVNNWGWNYAKDWPDGDRGTGHLNTILSSHPGLRNATKLVIPDTVTGFGNFTFDGSQINLDTIVFPNSYSRENLGLAMTRIQSNMTNYTIRSDNPHFDSIDGIIYDESHKKLLVCPINKTKIKVPVGVTTITQDSCAQNKCTSIGPYNSGATFELPDTITTLVTYCFGVMPNLEWAELPNGINLIEMQTFQSCPKLKSLYIPNSVTTIRGNYYDYFGGWYSMCYYITPNVHIYCQSTSKPNGWSEYWNATRVNGGNPIPNSQIHWNVSRETYRNNYRNN